MNYWSPLHQRQMCVHHMKTQAHVFIYRCWLFRWARTCREEITCNKLFYIESNIQRATEPWCIAQQKKKTWYNEFSFWVVAKQNTRRRRRRKNETIEYYFAITTPRAATVWPIKCHAMLRAGRYLCYPSNWARCQSLFSLPLLSLPARVRRTCMAV